MVQAVSAVGSSSRLAEVRMVRLIKVIRLLSLVRLLRISKLLRYVRQWEEASITLVGQVAATHFSAFIYFNLGANMKH